MTSLYAFGLLSSFTLFAGCVWRLMRTPHPHPTLQCQLGWLSWGVLHGLIAVAALSWIAAGSGEAHVDWRTCVIRLSVGILMIVPWHRGLGRGL